MHGRLSAYEAKALQEIREWKNPSKKTFLRRLGEAANWPLDRFGDLVMKIPGAAYAIEKTVGGALVLMNDAAQWSVPRVKIHEKYREAGKAVHAPNDIQKLDLEEVDQVIGWLAAKYQTGAALEGSTTGAVGGVGLVADVPALVTWNFRAIGEYATFCGFDTSLQQERLYALQMLGLASSPTDAAKQATLANLMKIPVT